MIHLTRPTWETTSEPRTMRRVLPTLVIAFLLLPATAASALQTLRGSSASIGKQNRVAQDHDYTFLETSSDVRRFVELGLLEHVGGDAHYELAAVSFPYARPAVRTFVERLAGQYYRACGEKLVVTSLTRPTVRQPRNASDQSVHPAGMAVDLRISNRSSCRRWLESTLLELEKTGVLDATRERRPAHYHVAVFPRTYLAYVDRLIGRSATRLASAPTSSSGTASGPSAEDATANYRVNRGDTLWSIARRHDSTVAEIKQLNGLRSSRIAAGQVLLVPTGQQ